jgi:hypothetical protein
MLTTQFFKAWKTLHWPKDYETVADRPIIYNETLAGKVSSAEEEILKRGGRPSIYESLVDEYRAGLGARWENTGEYYDHLKKNDVEKLPERDGNVTPRSSFADGLRRYDRDHPEDPSDKT